MLFERWMFKAKGEEERMGGARGGVELGLVTVSTDNKCCP